MENFNRKNHWESIYQTKSLNEVSWYQPVPRLSLNLIEEVSLPLEAPIIDIGGGDSYLVDNLIELGYRNITVLDISEAAIEKAKHRLGEEAELVHWVVSDVLDFQPQQKYALWHDRAAFHFLTQKNEKQAYRELAANSMLEEGILIVGTFSESGPKKCSGIDICQYSQQSLETAFAPEFNLKEIYYSDHNTPFNTVQNFIFGRFTKR